MLTCERAAAQLNDLFDGILTTKQHTILIAHLDACPDCKNQYVILIAVVHLVRQTPVADGVASHDRVMTRFRHTVTAENFAPRKAGLRIPFVPLGMAAAAVAGLTMLLVLPNLNAPEPLSENIRRPVAMSGLPSAAELDTMAGQHAAHSAQALAPNSELHNEAHADAFARLADLSEDDNL